VFCSRSGSIQTRLQIELVQQFAAFLSKLWILFPVLNQDHQDSSTHSNSGINLDPTTLNDISTTDKPITTQNGPSMSNSSTHPSPRPQTEGDLDRGQPKTEADTPRYTFEELLRNQELLLHGQVQVDSKYTPRVSRYCYFVVYIIVLYTKVILEVCRRIQRVSCDLSCDLLLHGSKGGMCRIQPGVLDCFRMCHFEQNFSPQVLSSISLIIVSIVNDSLNLFII